MSYLKQLASNRDERVQDLHLDLPIPTWTLGDDDRTPTLIARFGLMDDSKRLKKFLNTQRTPERDADFIINTVRELYAWDPDRVAEGLRLDDSKLIDRDDWEKYARVEEEGLPVKFDTVLAELMGVEGVKSARECLAYIFKMNDIAITGFCGRLIVWMQNTDMKVTGDLVGE